MKIYNVEVARGFIAIGKIYLALQSGMSIWDKTKNAGLFIDSLNASLNPLLK